MKCPECGSSLETMISHVQGSQVWIREVCYDAPFCSYKSEEREFFELSELLRLIEEAQDQALFCTPHGRNIYHADIIEAIKSYLSGNQEPLKKLEEAER